MNSDATIVLLVEDNPDDADLLREALTEVAFPRLQLTHCQFFGDGLPQLDNQHFDILLFDLSLPDATGLDSLVRVHQHTSGVPIIMLTGTDGEALALKTLRMGAQDYLIKGEGDNNDLPVRAVRYAIEYKQTEQVLQVSTIKLEAFLEAASEGIVVVNGDGQIVERHGGHIWVESESGQGSAFFFTIPTKEIT